MDSNELAWRALAAWDAQALLPPKVTVRGVHQPLHIATGTGLWNEEAHHFTMCNTKRALWYLTGSRFPRHLRRRQLTGEEQTRLERENKELDARVRELGEKLAKGS